MAQRKGRQQHVTSGNGNIHKRGDGLGTGPVGNGGRPGASGQQGGQQQSFGGQELHQQPNHTSPNGAYQGAGNQSQEQSEKGLASSLLSSALGAGAGSSNQAPKRGGMGKLILIVVILLVLFGGGGGLFGGLFGGGSSNQGFIPETTTAAPTTQAPITDTADISAILQSLGLGSMLGGTGTGSFATYEDASSSTPQTSSGTTFNTWVEEENTDDLNTEVSTTARKKYTKIKGNGKDTVTIMVYMCGTDLESSYGMGTNDLQEMLNAESNNSNINLLVYTGGCKKWKNNVVSSSVNQIYQIKNGKMKTLVADDGSKSMVDPSTLSNYILYCAKNFPANRYELILWDHGGGSVTGYGYDEKNARQGSMDLNGIKTALQTAKNNNVTFDFIGFDACLMATAETALMLDPYCDYMVASEESEPGVGWYYTDWLTKFAKDPSMDTLSIGKNICDDFVRVCASSCRGQSTTLSVIDVAEFAAAVPEALADFSDATTKLITGDDYKQVATARSRTREFAQSSRIDQIDLVHFAKNMDTKEGDALAETLLSAIKYNKTSSDMTNSYGVSIFFPYSSTKYVDAAVNTYKKIGLDTAYSKCIKEFASMEVSGQIGMGGNAGYSSSLLNMLGGSSNTGYSASGAGDLTSLLGSFLGGSSSSSSASGIGSLISGLSGSNTDFLFGRSISTEDTAAYLSENMLDPTLLNWKEGKNDSLYISMTKDQWSLVTDMALSMWYDDGEGYIDLGLDNIFDFDENGNLLAPEEATWLAIDGQAVAYYYDTMVDDGKHYTITGHVPAFLNDVRVNLIIVFDDANPYGYIAGATPVYTEEETELTAKNIEEVKAGDKLDFICDYYSYEGEYLDSYYLGDTITLGEEVEISNIRVDAGHANMMYKFTDIYNQVHWSECVTN